MASRSTRLPARDLNNDLVLNDRALFRERNAFTGPDYFQVDLRLSRRFSPLGSVSALELMVESENLFNRLNAVVQHRRLHQRGRQSRRRADFGRITATRPGRYVQFGARFQF